MTNCFARIGGVMVKALDYCFEAKVFELSSNYCVYFRNNTLGKGMNSFILPTGTGGAGIYIIIIMSRNQYGYPWLSLVTPPYRPLLSVGLQGYISYVRSSWSSCLCTSMWRGPQEYISYELVPTSPAVSYMSGSSNFDSFRNGWLVVVQLLLCWVLPPGLVQYCSQHSCVVAIKLFLHPFS